MIVLVTGILTAGGVLLLRPLSKRLAELLHVMTQERLAPSGSQREIAQLRELVERLDSRLALLEERQRFTEALLESRGEPHLLGRAGAEPGRGPGG